ncbi:hypothetical protein BV22DRAFT_1040694 [Leucogyrophana mollusca]|uniref:Uncharacterized protein n=1 Tax=Leucogyrophana mollusca TaxID=85980 RepID=A0ACB8B467_9AGAM|nr:hypothetical protein BV22DRAFT_1040694 [Leucogyrophana mollusca]
MSYVRCEAARLDSRSIQHSTHIEFLLPNVNMQETLKSGKFGTDSTPSPGSLCYPSCPRLSLRRPPYSDWGI